MAKNKVEKWVHPEQGGNEWFFTNATSDQFEAIPPLTKRKGEIAYDGNGNRLEVPNWYPVFIKQSELGGDILLLRKTRQSHRQSIE